MILSIFSCICLLFVYILWKKCLLGPLSIFLIDLFDFIYILDINLLSDIWFANSFLPFCRYLFTLLISFSVQEIRGLM